MSSVRYASTSQVRAHSPVGTLLRIVVLWGAAAGGVLSIQIALSRAHSLAAAALSLFAIVAAAFAYMRASAPDDGLTHALAAGTAWLTLTVVTEIVVAFHLGHGWLLLFGPADRPLLRNVILLAWIFAPVLFARSEEAE